MYSLEPGSKIIIFGTDSDAITAYYRYRKEFEVLGVLDPTQKVESCKNGISIFPPNKLHNLNGAIVIICKKNDMISAKWFKDNGFKLFESFIPKTLFEYEYINANALYSLSTPDNLERNINQMIGEKKLCMLHGNCQISVLQKYLIHNEKFAEDYTIIQFPEFFRMNDEMRKVYDCDVFYSKIDLLISQMISDENRFGKDISTSYIKQRLRGDCKTVLVSNMYMQAYFPQHKRINDPVYKTWGIKSFTWGDKYLDIMAEKDKSVEDVIREVNQSTFIGREEIRNLFVRDLEEMERRDSLVDVKIYDYLKEMAEKEILFWSVNHPKNIVFNVLARRLLVYLNYYASEKEVEFKHEMQLNESNTLKIACQAIYPSVNEYIYGKRIDINFGLPGEIKFSGYIGFREYVENYLNLVWNRVD